MVGPTCSARETRRFLLVPPLDSCALATETISSVIARCFIPDNKADLSHVSFSIQNDIRCAKQVSIRSLQKSNNCDVPLVLLRCRTNDRGTTTRDMWDSYVSAHQCCTDAGLTKTALEKEHIGINTCNFGVIPSVIFKLMRSENTTRSVLASWILNCGVHVVHCGSSLFWQPAAPHE